MLHKDPNKRPTIKIISDHPWIKGSISLIHIKDAQSDSDSGKNKYQINSSKPPGISQGWTFSDILGLAGTEGSEDPLSRAAEDELNTKSSASPRNSPPKIIPSHSS
jgi:hypothetical protein